MPQEPNVFISWSGDRSKLIAQKLRDWLPKVVQSALLWMSAENIEKGSRSIPEITKALGSATVGVVCLTLENLDRPWLLFDTRRLAKTIAVNVANQPQADDLDEVFDALWPSLHRTIPAAPAVSPTKQAKRSRRDT